MEQTMNTQTVEAAENAIVLTELTEDHAITDDTSEVPAQTGAEAPIPQTDEKDWGQREGRAFANRLRDARTKDRQKFEQEPAYRLGQQLISERMAREGITAEQAFSKLREEQISQTADEYAKDPKKFYEAQLRRDNAPRKQDPRDEERDEAGDLTAQLIAAHEDGIVPNGFAPQHVDNVFVGFAQRYGVPAALENWRQRNAQYAPIQAGAQTQTVPKPMRPVTNGVAKPALNFSTMSSEDFRKYDEEMTRAAQEGRRVLPT